MGSNYYGTFVRKLVKELERQGFRVRLGRHYVAYPPDKTKRVVAFPQSPSDWRGIRNMMRDLRSVGFKYDGMF